MGGGVGPAAAGVGREGRSLGLTQEVWVYLASEADIVQLDGEVLCYSKH